MSILDPVNCDQLAARHCIQRCSGTGEKGSKMAFILQGQDQLIHHF